MTSVFFTSDTHFNHRKVAELRQAKLNIDVWNGDIINAHNAILIDRWNETVTADDLIYVLGDIGLGKLEDTLDIFHELLGQKVLVTGNHDKAWPVHRTARKEFVKYLDAFAWVTPFAKIAIDGRDVMLSHFPYEGEGDHTEEDRFTEYRLRNKGKWLLHGHVHDAWKRRGRQINVGVDVWNFKPVSSAQLVAEMRSAETKWQDAGYELERNGHPKFADGGILDPFS